MAAFRPGRVVVVLLALVAAAAAGWVSTASAYASTPGGAIQVLGPRLERNGAPWIPRGVQIVGLVAPNGSLSGKYVAANQHFGAPELRQAIRDGADTVRFQVSQYGLDPLDSLFSRQYVREVHDAVGLARSMGAAVIVSLQAQTPAGRSGGCPLPDTGAQRAWNELAPMFAGDSGVMLELYNEPDLGASPPNWQMWEYGGSLIQSDGDVCHEVGMQTLIDDIRADGARNVVLVPGLNGEGTLAGIPQLSDPSNPFHPQFAYGIHYPSLTGGTTQWDREFGNFSAAAPVIVTEWYATSTHLCTPTEPAAASLLLDYLASKQIGIVGYAFDVPGTIIANWSYTPTTYSGFACGVGVNGPGQLLFGEFGGLRQAQGGSTQKDPAWIVSYSEVRGLIALAPGLARHSFDTPRTFVTGASSSGLERLGLPAAVPTAGFDSETKLASAVDRGALRAGTRAVLFDDEHWTLTPRAQQLHPGLYYGRAATVAHNHDLLLIAAPATDLVAAIAPKTRKDQTFAKFLTLRIAATAAQHADVFDVQAQSAETGAARYASFVRAATAQASGAHPGVSLLAGVSTNPLGIEQRSATLQRVVLATQRVVSGYWLNDPGRSAACPACTGPYPRVITQLLRKLGTDGI